MELTKGKIGLLAIGGVFGILPFVSNAFATFSFVVVTLGFTLPVWIVAKVGLMIIGLLPESRRPAARAVLKQVCYKCLNWAWWFTGAFSYWIRFRCKGLGDMQRGLNASDGKSRILLFNHLSFFDTILGISLLPNYAVKDMKAMCAARLFEMPVIGTLGIACEHIPVAFHSKTDQADMSIEKSAVADIQKKMDDHVRSGGIGCWFPEGRLHQGDGLQLQQFRAGGFSLPAQLDCEVWCVVMLGNAVMWPCKAAIGGQPANIGISAFRFCESSLAECAGAEASEGTTVDRAKALLLCNNIQKRMQEELDKLAAMKWCSIPRIKAEKEQLLGSEAK